MNKRVICALSAVFGSLLFANHSHAEPSEIAAAATGPSDAKAFIRVVKGTATYKTSDGTVHPLKSKTELPQGAIITTDKDGQVVASINGTVSEALIMSNSVVAIALMKFDSPKSSETVVQVQRGTLQARTQGMGGQSTYTVAAGDTSITVHKNTWFEVIAEPSASATNVTVTAAEGTLDLTGSANGALENLTLHKHQKCLPGQEHLKATKVSNPEIILEFTDPSTITE